MTDKPAARDLFGLYYLGVASSGEHAFRNLADVARHYGVERATVTRWLNADGLDPDTVTRVEFNLSAKHTDAMFVRPEARAQFVDEVWAAFQAARDTATRAHFVHDVDYDDL